MLLRPRRLVLALWRAYWDLPPRCCLRHRIDIALYRYGYRDYGDPSCPRCKPGD